ncbi:GD12283 [Drosophila simulans]|uniref:GD12283 n=1 Tax=Drosophila simulans TaxID=7240 RepID=B4QQF9_DROSI|nr:GD12283 [Drosophila simulans]
MQKLRRSSVLRSKPKARSISYSSHRSGRVLGHKWISHGSNHKSMSDAIVVPSGNLTTGSGHTWSESSYHDSGTRVSQRRRVSHVNSVGQRRTKESRLARDAGHDSQGKDGLKDPQSPALRPPPVARLSPGTTMASMLLLRLFPLLLLLLLVAKYAATPLAAALA